MKRLNSTMARNTVMAAAGAAILAGGAVTANAQQQQQQPQLPKGWFKVCTKQEDVDICNVQNIVVSEQGQLLIGLSMIDLKGKVNRKVFQVTVPSGRMLPPGIGLQIDGGQARKLEYSVCLPDRCIGEIPLTDDLVGSFKKGTQLTMTSVNFQNQPNPMQVSLDGFTSAFDGPPMKQSDVEDRQRQLEEFVNKNNEEFQKKLKEEQDKAKQQN